MYEDGETPLKLRIWSDEGKSKISLGDIDLTHYVLTEGLSVVPEPDLPFGWRVSMSFTTAYQGRGEVQLDFDVEVLRALLDEAEGTDHAEVTG